MFGLGKKRMVTLRVSAAVYDELASMIGAVDDDGVIDMTGIGLARAPEPVKPVHRPISSANVRKNTAPGAIS